MQRKKFLKGPTPTSKKKQNLYKQIEKLTQAVEYLNHKCNLLEETQLKQSKMLHNQASAIMEAIYGIRLLIQKDVITKDELLKVKETILNSNPISSEGSSVQSEESGTDVGSLGSNEP